MKSKPPKMMGQETLAIIIAFLIVLSIAGFSSLVIQQERILHKYFILDPKERMREYQETLANSLAKYFMRENKSSAIEETIEYIGKYGKTSLFETVFLFRDPKDGMMREISKLGLTAVTTDVLSGQKVFPATIDNGRIDGFLVIMIKDMGEAEMRQGLQKYIVISYSLRFMFLLLIAALGTILFYHNYSAKMRLAREMAEIKASNDGLTGLHTHEHFLKALDVEVRKFKIYHIPLALLIMDIDYFKKLNDTYGHMVGDKVLQDVGKIIKLSTRATDILARYGGEEFAVIIPYVEKTEKIKNRDSLKNFLNEVKNVAERIRKNVEEYKGDDLPETLKVTISIGGTLFYTKTEDISSRAILEKADRALYTAKESGRNKVWIDFESAL